MEIYNLPRIESISSDDIKFTFIDQYDINEMIELKNKLNKCKQVIDNLDQHRYAKLSNSCDSYSELKRDNGEYLKIRFGMEIVTNASLKMVEIFNYIKNDLLKFKHIDSFHEAEAPGSFICTLNALFCMYPEFKDLYQTWKWMANTYNSTGNLDELVFKKTHIQGDTVVENKKNLDFLGDNYGLIGSTIEKWLFGPTKDGDIREKVNILDFTQKTKENGLNVNLVTGDVKKDVKRDHGVPDYDNEEIWNSDVFIGQLTIPIVMMEKGGIAILKMLSFYETIHLQYLFLLTLLYDRVDIIKPETSRPYNSETYVVCIGYRKNLSDEQIDQLLNNCKVNYKDIKLLFDFNDQSELQSKWDVFIKYMKIMNDDLTRIQINALDELYERYKQYERLSVKEMMHKCRSDAGMIERARLWVEKYHLKPLAKQCKLLKEDLSHYHIMKEIDKKKKKNKSKDRKNKPNKIQDRSKIIHGITPTPPGFSINPPATKPTIKLPPGLTIPPQSKTKLPPGLDIKSIPKSIIATIEPKKVDTKLIPKTKIESKIAPVSKISKISVVKK